MSAFHSLFREKIRTAHGKHYLENVISRFDISYIDPLAVNVMPVGIPAAHSDALISKVSTFISLFNTCNKTFQNKKMLANKPSDKHL